MKMKNHTMFIPQKKKIEKHDDLLQLLISKNSHYVLIKDFNIFKTKRRGVWALESATPASSKTQATSIDYIHPNNQARKNKKS